MANDYFEEQFGGQSFGLAKVESVTASLKRVEAGFAKLPRLRALLEDRVTAVTATGGPTNYTVTMSSPPSAYVDGIALQVRFPAANAPNPTLDILDASSTSLGAKPIRQVDGTALSAGHIAENARAELYYVAEGAGYWTLGAGARGAQGPPGPPAGAFSVNAMKELVFTPSDGVTPATNLGAIAPLWQGAYAAATTYSFLDLVREGSYLYLHVGTDDTTGTAVTDTTVWQRYSDLPVDGGMLVEFRTATGQADPGNGRMRFNNATLASVTAIYLDDQDTNGNDLAAWVDTWDDYGSSADRAHLVIKGTGGDTETIVFKLTAVADLAGYKRLTVSHVAGSTLPGNGDTVSLVPLLRGVDRSESAFAALTFAADLAWNVGTTPNGTLTLTGDVTSLTLSGGEDGGVYELRIVQDGTGGHAITWPSAWLWPRQTAGALSSGANAVDRLMLRRDGTDIYAILVPDWGTA